MDRKARLKAAESAIVRLTGGHGVEDDEDELEP
jgi:hypothetical protein